jgi:hypothetical protein
MTSATKAPVTTDGRPVDSQRGLRRVVLGSSVGTSVLLGLILVFTDPGETVPAAAPANAEAEVAPGTETYPVPPQAAVDTSPVIAPLPVDRKAATASAPNQGASSARKADSDIGKAGRNHVTAHKPVAVSRPDARAARGNAASGAVPTRPEAVPSPDPDVAAPGPEIKDEVPSVDEPSGMVPGAN